MLKTTPDGMGTTGDKDLKSLFHDYARVALGVLRSANRGGRSVFLTPVAEYQSNAVQSGYSMRLDAYRALQALPGLELEQLREAKAVAAALPESSAHQRFYGSRTRRVRRVVEYYVHHRETLRYHAGLFSEDLEAHLRMWASHETTVVTRLPLVGIGPGVARKNLAADVHVVRWTDKKKSEFSRVLALYPRKQPFELVLAHYMLEIRRPFESARLSGPRIEIGSSPSRAFDTVTAMRLAQCGWVGALGIQECFMPSPRSDMFYSPHGPLNPASELETSGGPKEHVLDGKKANKTQEILGACPIALKLTTHDHGKLTTPDRPS